MSADDVHTTTPQELVVLGRLGAPHGVRGWVRVQSFTEPPEKLLQYPVWDVTLNGKTHQLVLKQGRPQGKMFVVSFEGWEDRDTVIPWVNAEVKIERQALPPLPEGEYYWVDLMGLEVITEAGVSLGHIDSIMETGANDVIVVKGTRDRLLPYLMNDVIKKIDLEANKMWVDWDPEF